MSETNVACKCPDGYPQERVRTEERDNWKDRGITIYPIPKVDVTYRLHAGDCPISDEVIG